MEIEPLDDGRFRVTVELHRPEADEVSVTDGLAGADPANRRLRREADGWWRRSYEVDAGARLSYRFTVDGGTPIADPLNPMVHRYAANSEDDPADEPFVVSLVELPGAPPLYWSLPRADVPQGTTASERLASTVLVNERRVYTYVPPGYDPARQYPLVTCFDGFAYVDASYIPLPTVLDNLIATDRIPPVVAVMLNSLDSATRVRELQLNEALVEFLTDELLPWARERLSFTDDPARTVVAGFSLGGLAAAFCGLRRPDRFGLVLSQSGAFSRRLPDVSARTEQLPVRFWLDVGVYETASFERLPSLYQANVHLRDVLVAQGYDVEFHEYLGGHDCFWWRETIADGLATLLA